MTTMPPTMNAYADSKSTLAPTSTRLLAFTGVMLAYPAIMVLMIAFAMWCSQLFR